MGKINQIQLEIEDRLVHGETPAEIARALDIPISWVYETSISLEFRHGEFGELRYEY